MRAPDVVVAYTDPPIIGLAARLVAPRYGARFVFVCQDIFPEVAGLLEDFQSNWVNHRLDRINRRLLRKADRIVALGKTMRDRLVNEKQADPSKITVIHNWSDCSLVEPEDERNPFSHAHGLDSKFVVAHSGNLGLSQNLETFIDAAELAQSQKDIHFAIIGDGSQRTALVDRARQKGLNNITFLPYQGRSKLRYSLASADVFVVSLKRGLAGYIVPSKTYGFMAAGRPILAAVEEACEVAGLVQRYDCGVLAKAGDANDLADKIVMLRNDPALCRRLGENARKAALDFDRPKQVRKYYEIFRSLVD